MTSKTEIQAIVAAHRTVSARVRALVEAGVPKTEIATILSISPNHVYSTLSRDRDHKRKEPKIGPARNPTDEVIVMLTVESGRIILAPEVLEKMELGERAELVLIAGPGEAHLMTREKAAAQLKAEIASSAPTQARLVDVLLGGAS